MAHSNIPHKQDHTGIVHLAGIRTTAISTVTTDDDDILEVSGTVTVTMHTPTDNAEKRMTIRQVTGTSTLTTVTGLATLEAPGTAQLYYDGTNWIGEVSPESAAIALNTTHRTSDGTDHTYIDQDVRTTASPTFAGLSIAGTATFNTAFTDSDFTVNKLTSGTALTYDAGLDSFSVNVNAYDLIAATSILLNAPADGTTLQNAPTGTVPLAVATVGYSDGLMTTHESAYVHSDIGLNTTHRGDATLHRVINDSGTSTTELWSANKIDAEIAAIQSGYNRRQAVIDIVDNTAVPPTEVTGDRYILDNTGVSNASWDGAAGNDIVQFDGALWIAETPDEGWVAYIDAQNKDALFVDDGTPAWELRPTIPVNHADLGLLGADDHTQYHNDARALTWLGTRSTTDLAEGSNLYYTEARVSANTDVAANTTHRTSDGTDHTYINQDVRTTATVTFGGLLLGATTTVNAIYDNDDMSPDSATALATQQSIKAYVDSFINMMVDNSVPIWDTTEEEFIDSGATIESIITGGSGIGLTPYTTEPSVGIMPNGFMYLLKTGGQIFLKVNDAGTLKGVELTV